MAFKTKKKESFNYKNPQEMYQDNKLKKIYGPLDYQSDMLAKYMEHENYKNLALELPTGSGKTLVGLLISEYRRRKNDEQVLFLCPTNQLVNQVVEQANEKYGIKAISFTGKQQKYEPKDKSDFMTASKIGVTTYSSFFSKNTFFDNVDIIVMDDVHSSEDYLISNWSVSIQKSDEVFYQIVSILKKYISDLDYYKLTCDSSSTDIVEWCDLIPTKLIKNELSTIITLLTNTFSESKNPNCFALERIRENLSECNFFISNNRILIRPWISPTFTSSVFQNAKQKILMSATLGRSGELERVTGIKNITRLPIVNDWDKKGLGRKFFTFPDMSFSNDKHGDIIYALHKLFKKSVFLVPNKISEKKVKEFYETNLKDTTIFDARSIEKGKNDFLTNEDAVVVLANRFDGVDFPNDESRLLFIYNLPKITNIQEQFLISRMGASKLYAERIRTRIIQAVGRCSRNPGDYSLVCILGSSIQSDLTKADKLLQFPPELRAELQFGKENSDNYTNVDDILEQASDFLARNDKWQEAEQYIVEIRNDYWSEENKEEAEINNMLSKSAIKEVEIQGHLWKKDYEQAYSVAIEIISTLNSPTLGGYKAYWEYIASSICYELKSCGKSHFSSKGIMHLNNSLKNNRSLLWLRKLQYEWFGSNQTTFDDFFYLNIENLERGFLKYKNQKEFSLETCGIIENLNSSDGLTFEKGHKKIGELLGYISENPTGPGAPDPYWILGADVLIVSEDKIYKEKERMKQIPIRHIDEANRHNTWIRSNEKRISKACEIITVLITNATEVDENAKIYCNDLYYVNKKEFIEWVEKSISVIKEAFQSFTNEGDSNWREATRELFKINKVTPKDYLDFVKRKKLKEM